MLLFIHFVSIAKYSYKTYSKNRNTRSKMCIFNFSRSCQILMAIAKMAPKQLHSNALQGKRAHFLGPHLLRYSLSLLNFVQSNQWTVASHWCLYLRSPHFYWGWTSLQCWLVISRGCFFFSFFPSWAWLYCLFYHLSSSFIDWCELFNYYSYDPFSVTCVADIFSSSLACA